MTGIRSSVLKIKKRKRTKLRRGNETETKKQGPRNTTDATTSSSFIDFDFSLSKSSDIRITEVTGGGRMKGRTDTTSLRDTVRLASKQGRSRSEILALLLIFVRD